MIADDRVALPLSPTIRPNMRGRLNGITSSRKISSQLVQRGRVLERVRRVGVVEAAAVGAELLDDLLAGHRAAGDVLGRHRPAWSRRCRLDRFCTMPAAMKTTAPTTAIGSRIRTQIRTRSTQKLPSWSVLRPGEAPHQRDRDRDADRRRDEVLHRQTGHLHQVAHRRLTRVRLPVGVRDEADRGVPRLIRHAPPGSPATATGGPAPAGTGTGTGCDTAENASTLRA